MFPQARDPVPAELLVIIFTDDQLSFTDLFRCTGVNKEWHSFIYYTPEVRKLLFLPPLDKQGQVKVAPQGPTDQVLTAHVRLQVPSKQHLLLEEDVLEEDTSDHAGPSWEHFTIHPILHDARIWLDDIDPDDDSNSGEVDYYPQGNGPLMLSYQLLRRLAKLTTTSDQTDSWRKMLIANPPITDLLLEVETYRCTPKLRINESLVQNAHGVTLGDVYDTLYASGLPRNMGLVPNTGKCSPGRYYMNCYCCNCYNLTEQIEDSQFSVGWERTQRREWEKEKREERGS
jgi:hypothetical protein